MSERLKAWLDWAGIDQEEMARLLKITPQAVSQWCLGITSPRQPHLEGFAAKIGIDLARFYGPIPKKKRKAS